MVAGVSQHGCYLREHVHAAEMGVLEGGQPHAPVLVFKGVRSYRKITYARQRLDGGYQYFRLVGEGRVIFL